MVIVSLILEASILFISGFIIGRLTKKNWKLEINNFKRNNNNNFNISNIYKNIIHCFIKIIYLYIYI